MTPAQRFPGLAAGMTATLDRVNRGQAANGVTTAAQLTASHEAEIARLENLLEVARERIRALEGENDNLRLLLDNAQGGSTRRELVTQAQAARLLRTAPYNISRWVKRGCFETAVVSGRAKPMIYADTLHIPTRRRKRRA